MSQNLFSGQVAQMTRVRLLCSEHGFVLPFCFSDLQIVGPRFSISVHSGNPAVGLLLHGIWKKGVKKEANSSSDLEECDDKNGSRR